MKRFLLILFLSLSVASAQNGGTIESRYGIGEHDLMATARQHALGGVTTPIPSASDLSMTNPASWSHVEELRLQGGFALEHISLSRGDVSMTNSAIKGFQFVLPLEDTWRLRLGTSLLPVSRSSYKTTVDGEIEGERYTGTYEGSGGLSLFSVGFALEPLPHVKVGAAYQYYFGTIDQDWELAFENTSYFPALQTRATRHSGSGLLLGLLYDGIRNVTFGLSIQPSTQLNAGRNLLLQYSTEDSILTGASGVQDIPFLLRLGAAWQLTEKILVAAEYSSQDWTDAIVFDRKQKQLGMMYKIGAGVEWYPYKDELGYRNLGRTAFRLGFYTQQPYLAVNDEPTTEYFITAGIGFPIFASNVGDIALEYGWRGTESDLLGKQTIFRAVFSISVGESWFIRSTD
ncbi:MAG: hypothetical protein JXA28_07620 [Bacteroidetes bacterium]|nr:hypothetical protein [Bacteroidota bacterium]